MRIGGLVTATLQVSGLPTEEGFGVRLGWTRIPWEENDDLVEKMREKTWWKNIKKRKKPGGKTSKRGKLKFSRNLDVGGFGVDLVKK